MAGERIEYFIVYEKVSGGIWLKSSGTPGSGALAVDRYTADGERAVLVLPYNAFAAIPGAGAPSVEQLMPLKAAVKAGVDAAVGAIRRRYVTDITGQQATYLAKEQEALAYQAGGPLDPEGYIAIEAAATGKDPEIVAAEILGAAALWRPLDRKLEGARRGAAVGIDAAETIPAIVLAATVDWGVVINGPAEPPIEVPPGEGMPQEPPPG